ncbi:MAG: hypothetical protein GXP55_01585 [Deltaproteobacteria bacterium]|nr:hypothetical protein [Deltaproteobacteria bacterium]
MTSQDRCPSGATHQAKKNTATRIAYWSPSRRALGLSAVLGVISLLLVLGPEVAQAISVQGTLGLPQSLGDATPVPDQYWEVRNGILPTRPDRLDPRRELTVVLRGPEAADETGCDYGLRGGDLMPRSMIVEAGSTLRITNHDATAHELHADALDGFTALSTAPGMARSQRIPAGGPYDVADKIYPHIHGKIVAVTGLVACGQLDARGAYRFANVAAGSYQLEVYRSGEVVAHQDVELADGGSVTLPELSVASTPAE